ncbi:MAG: hypothetical protein R6X18_04020 [Chloroflexota bacterium]
MQFAEAVEHHPVRFHVAPVQVDHPENRRSMKMFAYLGVPEEDRVAEAQMKGIAIAVRRFLMAG